MPEKGNKLAPLVTAHKLLELMGLVAHVYADTFAHAGFSGVSFRQNKVDAAGITPLNASAPSATYLDKKLDSFFRMFGFQGGLWTNVRRSIISDGAEIASGALGHGAVAVLPDLPYLKWSFRYEHSPETVERNNADTFLEACRKLHTMFQRFLTRSTGHDDGTSGIDFSIVEDCIKDILSFQNRKTQRSKKWRTAFAKGELGIKPGEKIPVYDPAPWDKQRNHFPALDKPEKAAAAHTGKSINKWVAETLEDVIKAH
ncbi:MAG: hypothetical protein H8D87_04405 [Deltaproteobacteria bacterium]|uniref:DUF6765 family protein n=1 Tax=Desulfobacula sp. TaxID=2593537 RepID=UPI0019C33113|nr:hypothetical protein [Candidatus Desulfobacula maris]MBL6992355.1 hypothetical protein [Desulfobacula sp.]